MRFDSSLLAEGEAACEAATLSAMENAYQISTTTMKSKMEELTGGLNLNLQGIKE